MSELFGGAGGGGGDVAAHEAAGNPHPTYTTDAEASALADAEVAAHEAAADPHAGYLLESDAAVVKTGQDNTYSTGAQSFAAATSLVIPTAAAPAPTADGEIAYGTTRDRYVAGGAGGLTGSFPRVLSVSHPNETKINDTTNDQDFTSVFTIPANYIIAQKVLRLSFLVQYITDGGASTQAYYFKLGTTKVFATGNTTPGNSSTRSILFQFLVFGTEAAGAAANVDAGLSYGLVSGAGVNVVAQPVALATNGTLDVVLGVDFGTSTGGESSTLLDAMVEELN